MKAKLGTSGTQRRQAYRGIIADWALIMSADRVAVASDFHAELLRRELPTFIDRLIEGAGAKVKVTLGITSKYFLPVSREEEVRVSRLTAV